MSSYYIVYGRDNCPWCEKARELLTQKKFEFFYLKLGFHYTKEELIEKVGYSDGLTVPQIFKGDDDNDDEYIGGYQDLVSHFEKDE